MSIRVGVTWRRKSQGKLKTSLNPFQIYPLCKGPRLVDKGPCGTSYRPLYIYLHPKRQIQFKIRQKSPELDCCVSRLVGKLTRVKKYTWGKLIGLGNTGELGWVTYVGWVLWLMWAKMGMTYLEGRFGVTDMKVTFATGNKCSLVTWLYLQSICEQCKRLFIFTVQK